MHSFAVLGLHKDKVMEAAAGVNLDNQPAQIEPDCMPCILDHYPASIYDKTKQQVT